MFTAAPIDIAGEAQDCILIMRSTILNQTPRLFLKTARSGQLTLMPRRNAHGRARIAEIHEFHDGKTNPMQSKQTVWPTLVCIACLITAAATICLQKRSHPLATASIKQTGRQATDSGTQSPQNSSDARPFSILTGTDHQTEVYKHQDGYQCTVKDLTGKILARSLTLTELAYEYPALHKLVQSELPE